MNSNKLLISSAIIGSFVFTSSALKNADGSDASDASEINNKQVAKSSLVDYLNKEFLPDATELATKIAISSKKVIATEVTYEQKIKERKAAELALQGAIFAQSTALTNHKAAITEADKLVKTLQDATSTFLRTLKASSGQNTDKVSLLERNIESLERLIKEMNKHNEEIEARLSNIKRI